MNIPRPKTHADYLARYIEIELLLRAAQGEQRRLLLIEQGAILSIINPTINPLA